MMRKLDNKNTFILLDDLFGTNKKKSLSMIPVVLLLILSLAVIFTVMAKAEEKTVYKQVVVKPGDTLWKISKDNIRQNEDIRCYIYEIRQINNLKTTIITPGQVIKLPKQ